MNSILIIEPDCNGHRAGYVRWIALAAAAGDCQITIATHKLCAGHPLFQSMKRELGDGLKLVAIDDPIPVTRRSNKLSLIWREVAYRRIFGKLYELTCKTKRPNMVIVPYLEHCANAIAIFGSPFGDTRWLGIVMRSTFHFGPMGIRASASKAPALKRWLFMRLLRSKNLGMLMTIDKSLVDYIQTQFDNLGGWLSYLADPADLTGNVSRKEARRELGFSDDEFVILLYGAIHLRKGVATLCQAMQDRDVPTNIHILLVGLQDQESQAYLASAQVRALLDAGRVHQINKFVSGDEEFQAFRAADVVWLGYRGHQVMSGVMVQAGHMSLPTIACQEGLIGRLTATNRSGIVVDVEDLSSVRKGLLTLVHDSALAQELGRNGYQCFRHHTVKKFSETIRAALDSTLQA